MIILFKRQDWVLNALILALAFFSLTTIFSAERSSFFSQLIWFIIAFLIIFSLSQIDWQPIANYKWMIFGFYFFTVVLLLSTLVFAPFIRQSRGWLVFGPFQFQPSELAKVSLLILLTYFFAKRHIGIAHLKTLVISFVYFFIPGLIILIQPDWGSALVLFGLWIGFLLISGIRWRHLLIGAALLVILGFASWSFLFADYQKERIIGFLEPSYDPLGVNYSVIQSKIAIGSAGIFGKGFMQGTQTQLGFLTESSTDFIFAALVEEWGFLGGFFLLLVFLILIFKIIRIGLNSNNNFSQLICLGTVILFLMEFIINIGSNIGLLPVVGVTFPLFSYGGSSLLTKAILLGIIQSIAVRNKF